MAKFYATQIRMGRTTLEQVPAVWREKNGGFAVNHVSASTLQRCSFFTQK